jgi:ribosomal protein S17E
MIDFREMVSEYGRWIDWDSPTNKAIIISFQVLSKSLFRNHVTVQHNIILGYWTVAKKRTKNKRMRSAHL